MLTNHIPLPARSDMDAMIVRVLAAYDDAAKALRVQTALNAVNNIPNVTTDLTVIPINLAVTDVGAVVQQPALTYFSTRLTPTQNAFLLTQASAIFIGQCPQPSSYTVSANLNYTTTIGGFIFTPSPGAVNTARGITVFNGIVCSANNPKMYAGYLYCFST